MLSRPAAGLAVLLAAAACSSSSTDPPCEPAAAPLAGVVGGASWSLVSGVASPSPVDPAEGVLDLYADALDVSSTCVAWGAVSSSFVMVRLPSALVRAGFDDVVDVWFCIKSGNVSATCGEPTRGVLRIDARNGTTMAGALCGTKGGDRVSGTFSVPDGFP